MGTRVIRTDDLTGKDAEVTKAYKVTFTPQDEKDALDSAENVVDLTPDSAKALFRWLTENDSRDLVSVLRNSPRRLNGSEGSSESTENEVIRAWAKARTEFSGKIKDRGAIPGDIVRAYRAAHPATPPTVTENK